MAFCIDLSFNIEALKNELDQDPMFFLTSYSLIIKINNSMNNNVFVWNWIEFARFQSKALEY